MSKLDLTWQEVLARDGISTAQLFRFDFADEPMFVWTGSFAVTPTNTGDDKLDGNTFQSIGDGVIINIGENAYSMSGSNALNLTIALPASLPDVLAEANINENQYLARPAYMWRAVMQTPAGLAAPSVWLFRRTRTGAMDQVSFTADGTQMIARLTIGSHASYISGASQSRYSDQKRFDPTDTSQDYQYSVTGNQSISNSVSYTGGGGGGTGEHGQYQAD